VSARAETDRSFITAIRADIGEAEAYKQALHRRGGIGLQRPLGVNVSGVDFITAARNPKGQMEIIVTDVKTRATPTSRFPSAKKTIPGTWSSEADQATSAARLRLNNPPSRRRSATPSLPDASVCANSTSITRPRGRARS